MFKKLIQTIFEISRKKPTQKHQKKKKTNKKQKQNKKLKTQHNTNIKPYQKRIG